MGGAIGCWVFLVWFDWLVVRSGFGSGLWDYVWGGGLLVPSVV